MPRTRSLRSSSLLRQTIVTVLLTQLACAIALAGAALWQERRTRFQAFDRELLGHSDSLLGAIQDAEDPDDNVTVDAAELVLPQPDVWAVYNQGGRLLGTSAHPPAALILRRGAGIRSIPIDGERYRVLERNGMRIIDRAENDGAGLRRPVTIVYAAPEQHLWHEIVEAASYSLVAITLAATITALLVTVLLRRALQPVPELAAAAAELSLPALHFRAPAAAFAITELRPLAEVLTSVVGRMKAAYAKEQQFVGDAAHELKTAVAVVRSSVQLLMLAPRTPRQYDEGLERVLQDTERVEALVAQMLQLACFDAQIPAHADAVQLAPIASAVIDRLQPLAQHAGATVQLRASAAGATRMQAEGAEVLISNLLRNAIQYSAQGAVVQVSIAAPSAFTVALEVQDHGCGIDAAALPFIFDRFFREDRARARSTGGTGLGLSICKAIVEHAGGTILVQSAPGVGTTVRVVFTQA